MASFGKFSDWVGNAVGKEEIARYEQIARHERFLLFPQSFRNTYTADAEKRACLGKDYKWQIP